MKIIILTLWCLVPLGLLAYHYGPGREGMVLDETASLLDLAAGHAASEDWAAAISTYEDALARLPKERLAESRQIRLELAKARMENAELPKAREELADLAAELSADPAADPLLVDDSLATLSSARFYMTYLMKLEGLPDTEWEPEIDAARQERKWLVHRATERGDTIAAAKHADDLEAAIRLARMEPEELYGKAIPKQCSGCCSGKCASNKPGRKPATQPADARGASAGPPIDGEGS